MKKIVNLKEIMMILISIVLITVSTTVLATDPVLDNSNANDNNNTTTISPDEYENAQNASDNNTNTNNANTTNTTNNTDNDKLPQTGIEDSGVGILLIICIGSAIFAYRKISDYRNI